MENYGAQVNAGEHRARVRIECSTKVELFSERLNPVTGKLKDISLSGMFCNVPAGQILPEFEGEIVSARLIMEHGSSSLNIETVARVVRCEEDGVALSFIDSLIWWPIFTIFRKPAGSSGLRPLLASAQERREGIVIQ